MNPKILTFVGLGLTLAGTIVSAVASNQIQQLMVNEAVNAKFAQLQK